MNDRLVNVADGYKTDWYSGKVVGVLEGEMVGLVVQEL